MMYCIHCGKEIENNSQFCSFCGQKVPEELILQMQQNNPEVPRYTMETQPEFEMQISDFPQTVPQADQNLSQNLEQKQNSAKQRSQKKLVIAIIAIAATLSVVLGAVAAVTLLPVFRENSPRHTPSTGTPVPEHTGSISDFEKDLRLNWSNQGIVSRYNDIVDFSLQLDGNMLTCSYTYAGEETIFTAFRYEVVSNHEIRRAGTDRIYTVTINKEKNALLISPALTTTEDSELWYCYDNGLPSDNPFPNLPDAELKALLMRPWTRTEGVGGTSYTYDLWFDGGIVTYSYQDASQMDYNSSYFGYRIISSNQIQSTATNTVYTFSFNEERTVMTVSPAISSDNASEQWFYMGN